MNSNADSGSENDNAPHPKIYILPNLITTANMFFGFFAMVHAMNASFLYSAYAIVAAAVFDMLDGRIARWTRSTSDFGAEYDSLSDIISFGVAPCILLLQWSLKPFGRIGMLAAFFYLACAALRLARFNVQRWQERSSVDFEGLPTPIAAGLVASSVMAFFEIGRDATQSWVILSITIVLGFAMVSSFRYRSFKDVDFKERVAFPYLVGAVFIFAIIAIEPQVTLFVLFLTYTLLGIVFGVRRYGRLFK